MDAIYEALPDIFYLFDESGTLLRWNDQLSAVTGYTDDEISEMRPSDFFEDADEERIVQAVGRIFAGEGPVTVEAQLVTKSGERVPYEFSGALARETDGTVIGAVGVGRDVTERVEYESQLESERRKYEQLTENLSAVIYRADPETLETTYVNSAIEDVFGYSPEEMLEHDELWIRSIHPNDVEQANARIQHLKQTREDGVLEYRVVTKGGSMRWVEDHISWERDDAGNVVAMNGIIYDVTDRVAAQESVEQRNRQLTLLNRIVRHDIRNDMQVVLGWEEMLRDTADEEQREKLDHIRAACEHTVGLTKIVRDFIRTMKPEETVELESIAIKPLLHDEAATVQEAFGEATITFEGEVPDVRVRANGLLTSVFRNILNNAIQHNDSDEPRVEIRVEDGPEMVTVRIADNGPGIPDDQKDAIFGRTEKGLDDPAAGIGLYLVDTLVTRYGGTVHVEDNEPRGAVFVVRLQRASAP